MHYTEILERGNSVHGGKVQTRTCKRIKWLQAKTLPTADQKKVAERNKKKVGNCRAQLVTTEHQPEMYGLGLCKGSQRITYIGRWNQHPTRAVRQGNTMPIRENNYGKHAKKLDSISYRNPFLWELSLVPKPAILIQLACIIPQRNERLSNSMSYLAYLCNTF